jgi:hypothetical protein
VDPFNDDVPAEQLADYLDLVDQVVRAELTPEEMEIRKDHLLMMIEVENILEEAAGEDPSGG